MGGFAALRVFFFFCFLALKVFVVVFGSLLAAIHATQGRCFFFGFLLV